MDTRPNKRTIHTLFVTALQAEATPLVAHYRLKALRTRAFRFYQSANVSLVVCGIGETAAASATSFALGFLPAHCTAINIGIAGSDNPVGSLFQASTICRDNTCDEKTAHGPRPGMHRSFYPHLPFKGELPTLRVTTVVNPRIDYMSDCCFEMEAYGFCFAARQFLAAEQVHCLKVISDNPGAPLDSPPDSKLDNSEYQSNQSNQTFRFDAATISNLIHAQLGNIENFSTQLASACQKNLSTTTDDTESALAAYISQIENSNDIQMHFSESRHQQLLRLLSRYLALGKELPQNLNPGNSKDLLNLLETGIAGYLPGYTSKNATPSDTN